MKDYVADQIVRRRAELDALVRRREIVEAELRVLEEVQRVAEADARPHHAAKQITISNETPATRSLSLEQVLQLSDEEALALFAEIRWSDNNGRPYCPHCGYIKVYIFHYRPIWRCKRCGKQFSITSGTIFHSRKLAIRDYLAAITIFVNGTKKYSTAQISRDLSIQYRTALVLAHKLREAIGSEIHDPDHPLISNRSADSTSLSRISAMIFRTRIITPTQSPGASCRTSSTEG
jgi:transposase-like protein